MIVYRDPPYAALPREYLLARIVGLGPKITVCEDLFYALMWCYFEGFSVPLTLDIETLDIFEIEGVYIVKG